MSKFLYEVDDDKFLELREERFLDNKDVCEYLQKLVDNDDDRRFNFTMLNLGTLMQICSIELEFKQEEIEKYLKLKKEQIRDRRMNNIIKELNHKINLRYEFDEKTEIIPCLYTYKGVGHIYIDKIGFCKLLDSIDIGIQTLKNI